MISKGHFYISTQELYDIVIVPEKETEKKAGKKGKKKGEVLCIRLRGMEMKMKKQRIKLKAIWKIVL